jgi:hypothetical protein
MGWFARCKILLTVDETRRRAKAILGAEATGEDPAGNRNVKRREKTIRALTGLYETEGCYFQRGVHAARASELSFAAENEGPCIISPAS